MPSRRFSESRRQAEEKGRRVRGYGEGPQRCRGCRWQPIKPVVKTALDGRGEGIRVKIGQVVKERERW